MRFATLLRDVLIGACWAVPIALLTGCSPSSQPSDCPPPHPTFRLTVSSLEGHVPGDVTIHVTYGGGVEKFDARHPDDTPTSVFCSIRYANAGGEDASTEQDASAPGGAIDRVVCELWTDGAAKVTVKASGYPELERELSAKSDDCGLVTSEEEVRLEHGD